MIFFWLNRGLTIYLDFCATDFPKGTNVFQVSINFQAYNQTKNIFFATLKSSLFRHESNLKKNKLFSDICHYSWLVRVVPGKFFLGKPLARDLSPTVFMVKGKLHQTAGFREIWFSMFNKYVFLVLKSHLRKWKHSVRHGTIEVTRFLGHVQEF